MSIFGICFTVAAAYVQDLFANSIFAYNPLLHISEFCPKTRAQQNNKHKTKLMQKPSRK